MHTGHQDQPHSRRYSQSRLRRRSRSRPRRRSQSHPRRRSRSRSRGRSRSRSHSRGRSRSRPHSHPRLHSRDRSRSHSHSPSHHHQPPRLSHKNPNTSSPPRYTYEQKGKAVEGQAWSHHQATVRSPQRYRSRPGPSSSAHPKRSQRTKSPPKITDEEDSEEETPKQVYNPEDITWWRHVGKQYSLRYQTWLSRTSLRYVCQCESPEDAGGEIFEELAEFLDISNIKLSVRKSATFRSEVHVIHFNC